MIDTRHHGTVHLDGELGRVLAELTEQVGDGKGIGQCARFGIDGDGRHRRLRKRVQDQHTGTPARGEGGASFHRPACYNYRIRYPAGDHSMSSAVEPTADFFDGIRASGLLTPAQIDELSGWIGVNRPDVQAFARELNRRGWLTAFQIKEVFRGRGQEARARALCPSRSSRRRRNGARLQGVRYSPEARGGTQDYSARRSLTSAARRASSTRSKRWPR